MSELAIQQHPDYHEGFFDAMDGTPIWADECTAEYRAGWEAAYEVKRLLSDPDALVRTGKLPDDPHADGGAEYRNVLN